MPLAIYELGDVLVHIYDLPFGSCIYLPRVDRYEVGTPCMAPGDDQDDNALAIASHYGFENWLNVAVISDTYDEVREKNPANLVVAFNADCRERGWLDRMMNYRNPDPPPP
jgi:hypothetical protein